MKQGPWDILNITLPTQNYRVRTNSHILSQRLMTSSYDDFIFVPTRASKRATCFATSCGCTFASASNRVMCATTWGVGTGVGLGRPKMDPRERGLLWHDRPTAWGVEKRWTESWRIREVVFGVEKLEKWRMQSERKGTGCCLATGRRARTPSIERNDEERRS